MTIKYTVVRYFRNMPKRRKSSEDHDPETVKGRAALSLLRNRGADRVLKQVKEYQKASQHKVRFIMRGQFKAKGHAPDVE